MAKTKMCRENNRKSILIVSANVSLQQLLQLFLEARGFEVDSACNCRDMQERLARNEFNLVLAETKALRDSEAFAVNRIVSRNGAAPVIAIATLEEQAHLRHEHVLTKPLRMNELTSMIQATAA